MNSEIIKTDQKETNDEVVYNEYYIKDIKSKIRKYIEMGDEKFIRALKTLIRSNEDEKQL
ncbi:MAG: hypothetical protein N2319_10080 [Candidatus Kapabacteria bacterium]|nr:hypothetical protein [Candidatus Kapabacteria bacterium]